MNYLPVLGIESPLRILSDEKRQKICDPALTIIADIGMTDPNAEARDILVSSAGTPVGDNDVVKIPRDAVAKTATEKAHDKLLDLMAHHTPKPLTSSQKRVVDDLVGAYVAAGA
jgi:hypothetical protein